MCFHCYFYCWRRQNRKLLSYRSRWFQSKKSDSCFEGLKPNKKLFSCVSVLWTWSGQARNEIILHLRYLTGNKLILSSGKTALSLREISSPFLFIIRLNENKSPGQNYGIHDNKICLCLTREKKKKKRATDFFLSIIFL